MNEENIDVCYVKTLKFIDELSNDYSVDVIAGVMMTLSLSLYKTILTNEAYQDMTQMVYEKRNEIKSFDVTPNNKHLH